MCFRVICSDLRSVDYTLTEQNFHVTRSHDYKQVLLGKVREARKEAQPQMKS